MLRLDFVYLAGRLRASHPLIRRVGLLLTVCSSPSLTVERTFPPPPLWSAGQTRLDWNPHSSGVWTTSLPCGLTQNACQRVFLILLLLCVFAFLTAELPLTVLYLSLPLRKLLQYLWFLCNGEWVNGCVCVCVNVCVCGCGCRVLANPAPTWTSYFLFYLNSSYVFLSCSLQPKPGFYHKAGLSVSTDVTCRHCE